MPEESSEDNATLIIVLVSVLGGLAIICSLIATIYLCVNRHKHVTESRLTREQSQRQRYGHLEPNFHEAPAAAARRASSRRSRRAPVGAQRAPSRRRSSRRRAPAM